MRFRLIGMVAAALCFSLLQAASAADMPVKAPIYKAPVAAATNWTGLYVNGGFGYGIWSADTTTLVPGTTTCILCVDQVQGGKGWLGVVGVGYDYQFAQSFVAGVFGDVNFGSIKGTLQDQGPFFVGDTKEQWAWAAGARLGYLLTPDALAYVNGGYTSARFSSATMVNAFAGAPTGFFTPAVTMNGWFVGGGAEIVMPSVLGIQFGPGWFWRNEYRYASYGSKTLTDTDGAGGVAADITFKPAVQTVTSQIVYKFNTGGPTYHAAPPPPANWNGFYVNAGLGYGGWAADTTTVVPGTGTCVLCETQRQGGKGWLGAVGAGFDYVVMPRIVAGVFGDVNFSSLKGSIQDQGPFFEGDIKQDWAWAAGARAGWVVTPQVLSYVNGGYTAAHFSGTNMVLTFNGAATGFSTPAFTASGWFLGGGVEAAVAPGWFWRNEYRSARYESKTLPDTAAGGPITSITFKPTVQTVTSQLVYKFNWMR